MIEDDPLNKSKDEFEAILEKIRSADSPVGIDAQYTHAIIIAYLRRITERLDKLEAMIRS
ncbi:MAG: hypothetical protein IID09_04740 [Candidatus Hydrogenedentes bacterium]|nr:hypothetical protein [Candidatus Hydrogenedentota bacterium]